VLQHAARFGFIEEFQLEAWNVSARVESSSQSSSPIVPRSILMRHNPESYLFGEREKSCSFPKTLQDWAGH
jgi:hypothetical protein